MAEFFKSVSILNCLFYRVYFIHILIFRFFFLFQKFIIIIFLYLVLYKKPLGVLMSFLRNLSIGNKISILLTLILLVGNVAVLVLVSINIEKSMQEEAKKLLLTSAIGDAHNVTGYFEATGVSLEGISKAVSANIKASQAMSSITLGKFLEYIVDHDSVIIASYIKIDHSDFDARTQKGFVMIDREPNVFDKGVEFASLDKIKTKGVNQSLKRLKMSKQ